MFTNDYNSLNIGALMQSFMAKRYIYTAVVDLTDDICFMVQRTEGIIDNYPEKCDFDYVFSRAEEYVHPMFVKQYYEHFSKENLLKAYDADEEVVFQFLHYLQRDRKYHWITKRLVPVHDNSGHVTFIGTAHCTDEEKAAADKNRQDTFNIAVINQLIYNYVLVHVVELNNSMSRLVHTKYDDFYHAYELRFPSHTAMMNHLYENFVQPDGKEEFKKLSDYSYVKEQFDSGEERLLCRFTDNRGVRFELTVAKYIDYAPDNPLVIYAIRELNE